MSQQVNIVAPSDMEEGYQFDAQVDGKTVRTAKQYLLVARRIRVLIVMLAFIPIFKFTVTVPEGGVKAGQEFTTVAPFASEDDAGTSGNSFRYGLFECCTCDAQFFMGWCCSAIVLGQLLQRLKLTFYGVKTDDDQYQNSCMILTIAYGVAVLLGLILAIATGSGVFIMYVFGIYMIVVLTITRLYMRKLYSIPGQLFGDSPLDDCCYSYWCTCCTILQLVRHTHDEKVYAYKYDSKTGLPEGAPEIV